MATYNVVKTNGQVYTVLSESELDTSTGLNLIGQNFRNYGELIASNFFRLLENFADSTPPDNPIEGQLWWDTNAKILNFFDGGRFKSVTGNSTQDNEPLSPSIGDNWWDTRTDQLKVYTGTRWVVAGPTYEKIQGVSGTFPRTVVDSQSAVHVVNEVKINDQVVAIVSNDEPFTLASAVPGFTTITRGINLSSTGTLNGTALNATRLGNAESSKYLNIDSAATTINGNVTLSGTRQLTVGSLQIKTESNGQKTVTATGNDLILKTTSGTLTLTEGGELQCPVQPTTANGVANKAYVDNKAATIFAEVPSNIIPLGNNNQDIGSATKRWNVMYGSATAVIAGDLAERYVGDKTYAAGTVVVFGGEQEITTSDSYCDTRIAGVVSTEPGYLMGDTGPGIAIALTGKVPCMVVGPVTKGDILVNSHLPGVATALAHPAQWKPGCVVGKSLETSTVTGTRTINIVVGRF